MWANFTYLVGLGVPRPLRARVVVRPFPMMTKSGQIVERSLRDKSKYTLAKSDVTVIMNNDMSLLQVTNMDYKTKNRINEKALV